MDNASDGFISDEGLIGTGLVNDDVHSVRVSEVVEMEEALLLSEQVKRVKSISLPAVSVVNLFRSISVEDGPFACSFSKIGLKPFTQTVNVTGVNFCTYLNVVFSEYDVLIVS
jgi:hypothetical protein